MTDAQVDLLASEVCIPMYEKFRTVAGYIAWRTKTYEKLRAVIPEQAMTNADALAEEAHVRRHGR